MFEGKIIIFSAPSGAGKTTLVKYLLAHNSDLAFSVSATTRACRPGEVHGKDYYFISKEEFEKHIANHDFVEYEEVYAGTYYGTLKSEIERIWAQNKHVIIDADVKGGLNIKKQYKERALSVFVQPPNIQILEQRLRTRNTDSEESIRKRMEKAISEITFGEKFDVVILNDNLDKACAEAQAVYERFKNQSSQYAS
ncbi:MAG: guanylate kinase [Cytophagales bacterium]|nr:guanylate kinase [Cytophagales bacterium]MDW8383462.1 guanylate kinase [Flammeovirgaceae bacterium]